MYNPASYALFLYRSSVDPSFLLFICFLVVATLITAIACLVAHLIKTHHFPKAVKRLISASCVAVSIAFVAGGFFAYRQLRQITCKHGMFSWDITTGEYKCMEIWTCRDCGLKRVERKSSNCVYDHGVCVNCHEPRPESDCSVIYAEMVYAMQDSSNIVSSLEIVKERLDMLPYGYRDTDDIREQYADIQSNINVFLNELYKEASASASGSGPVSIDYASMREAFENLMNKTSSYSLWNLKDSLMNMIFSLGSNTLYLEGALHGEWKDDKGNFIMFYNKTTDRTVSTTLPNARKKNTLYTYYLDGRTVYFINKKDPSDKFPAYTILSINISNIVVECINNGELYMLAYRDLTK